MSVGYYYFKLFVDKHRLCSGGLSGFVVTCDVMYAAAADVVLC